MVAGILDLRSREIYRTKNLGRRNIYGVISQTLTQAVGPIANNPIIVDGMWYAQADDNNYYMVQLNTDGDITTFNIGQDIVAPPESGDGFLVLSYSGSYYILSLKIGDGTVYLNISQTATTAYTGAASVNLISNDLNYYTVSLDYDTGLIFAKIEQISNDPVIDGIAYLKASDGNYYTLQLQTNDGLTEFLVGQDIVTPPTAVSPDYLALTYNGQSYPVSLDIDSSGIISYVVGQETVADIGSAVIALISTDTNYYNISLDLGESGLLELIPSQTPN